MLVQLEFSATNEDIAINLFLGFGFIHWVCLVVKPRDVGIQLRNTDMVRNSSFAPNLDQPFQWFHERYESSTPFYLMRIFPSLEL